MFDVYFDKLESSCFSDSFMLEDYACFVAEAELLSGFDCLALSYVLYERLPEVFFFKDRLALNAVHVMKMYMHEERVDVQSAYYSLANCFVSQGDPSGSRDFFVGLVSSLDVWLDSLAVRYLSVKRYFESIIPGPGPYDASAAYRDFQQALISACIPITRLSPTDL